MDAGSLRAQQDRPDPHGWNTLENFRDIHEKRLAEHPFVDHSTPDTLRLDEYELSGDTYFVLWGEVYCHHNVIVEVTKYYESRVLTGRVQIRGFSYRYNAHVRGGHNVLRYDNGHDDAPDEFHRHAFDLVTGDETEKRVIARYELPVFADILTEVQELVEGGAPT